MITYNQLRTFLAVVRAGSLTRAARELRASQPTVSLQLRALRRSLGVVLIERPDSGFRLTPAGEKLRRYAEETLGGLRTLEQDIAALKGTLAGPLVVGVTFILSGHVLPAPLSRFRAQFPAVDMRVHVDLPEPLLASLAGGALDVACYLRVRTPPGLTVELLGNEEFALIASPKHPLAGRRRITPQELSEYPFVAMTSTPIRELHEEKLHAAGVKPRTLVETRNHDAVLRLVEANAGYALQIKPLVANELATGQLVALNLEGPPLLADVVAAFVTRPVASPLIHGLVGFLRAELARCQGGVPRDERAPLGPERRAAGSAGRRRSRA